MKQGHNKRERKETKQVRAGNLLIGGDAPVSVQSMTNIPLEDVKGTIEQIKQLERKGAELVRLAVRKEENVSHLKKIISAVNVPLCADIHFNHRIAVESIKAGINKVRINPGNIGSPERVKEVVRAANDNGIPVRIGVNGGSIDKKKYSNVTPENLVESAIEHVQILEDNNFNDIVVSIKSSDVFMNIAANRLFSDKRDYPLHIGLTEAGFGTSCIIDSSVTIGHLLMQGLGDTIRVSMTGDPVEEITIGKKILESVGERFPAVKIISCPTCGRTDPELNILKIARDLESAVCSEFEQILIEKNHMLTLAVMGCEVNGPGEASEADFGLAGARHGEMLLFAKGEKSARVKSDEAVFALIKEIRKYVSTQLCK